MICERPFIRSGPHGIKKIVALTNNDARLASTPFPCGKCMPCRIHKSSEWQLRILLETTQHDENLFTTLTYDDEHRRPDKQLSKNEIRKFLKKLRKVYKIKFFAVGEYGERENREHYHLALFGIGQKSIASIDRLWGKGFTYHGELNKKSAGYIARYTTKGLDTEYKMDDPDLIGKQPEFQIMSRGLGKTAIEKIGAKLLKSGAYDGRLINSIRIGKSSYPLGRYLTDKLASVLGTKEDMFLANFLNVSDELICNNMKGGEIFVENVIEEEEGKRLSKKKRLELFTSQRKV